MRALIAKDDGQLRRLESSIAAFRSRSAAEQSRMAFLLAALEREKAELLSFTRHPSRRQSEPLSH